MRHACLNNSWTQEQHQKTGVFFPSLFRLQDARWNEITSSKYLPVLAFRVCVETAAARCLEKVEQSLLFSIAEQSFPTKNKYKIVGIINN